MLLYVGDRETEKQPQTVNVTCATGGTTFASSQLEQEQWHNNNTTNNADNADGVVFVRAEKVEAETYTHAHLHTD